MDRRFTTIPWQVLPDLIRGKDEYRREHARKRVGDPEESRLSGAARVIAWRISVEPVLHDIEIPRRECDRGKVVQRVIDRVELVSLVGFQNSVYYQIKFGQGPAINLQHLIDRDSVTRGFESVEISERETRRVAQLAITIGNTLQNLRGCPHVVKII